MKCFYCNATPDEAGVLHRINPKGQPGIWACEEHVPGSTTIDAEVQEIVDIIRQDKKS